MGLGGGGSAAPSFTPQAQTQPSFYQPQSQPQADQSYQELLNNFIGQYNAGGQPAQVAYPQAQGISGNIQTAANNQSANPYNYLALNQAQILAPAGDYLGKNAVDTANNYWGVPASIQNLAYTTSGLSTPTAGYGAQAGELAGQTSGLAPTVAGLGGQAAGLSPYLTGLAGQAAGYQGGLTGLAPQYQGYADQVSGLAGRPGGANALMGAGTDTLSQIQGLAGRPTGANQLIGAGQNVLGQSQALAGRAAGGNQLVGSGRDILQTAFDPQNQLEARQRQQLQDQTRAALASQGLSKSPYAASTEAKALSDFGIDWQNQQLARQQTGLGAAGSAFGQAENIFGQKANILNQGLGAAGNAFGTAGNLFSQKAGELATGLGAAGQAYGQAGNIRAQKAGELGQAAGITGQEAALYPAAAGIGATAGGLYGQGGNLLSQAGGLYNQAGGLNTQAAAQLAQGGSLYGQAGNLNASATGQYGAIPGLGQGLLNLGAGGLSTQQAAQAAPASVYDAQQQSGIGAQGQALNALTGATNIGAAQYNPLNQALNSLQSYLGLGQSASSAGAQINAQQQTLALQEQLVRNQALSGGLQGVGTLAGLAGGAGKVGSGLGGLIGSTGGFAGGTSAAEAAALAAGNIAAPAGSGILGALPLVGASL